MFKVGDKLGRFRLDKEIGQGSHGVVYVATDTALDARVAVKVLHPWLTEDTAVRDRFKRELLLARRITHPGICRLFDLHQEADAFFITMEFVEGQTLLNILKNEGRLTPARGVKILRGVCQALAAAHAVGVIHRDLKPANIIVRGDDNPMILDFGTATAGDVSRVTRPGTAVGSMRFIAPEVFSGVSPSIRTDVYSLGVCAYVTFAGKLPYNAAAGAIEMLELIQNQPPVRIDAMQPDVPARLADVVARSMAKDPEQRFASAQAFDEALTEVENEIKAGTTVPSRPPVDFAKWAPSQVIRDTVGPKPVDNLQPAPTIVDMQRPAALTLGTQVPDRSTDNPSAELPVITGNAVPPPGGQTLPSEDALASAFDGVLEALPTAEATLVAPEPRPEATLVTAPPVERTVRVVLADLEPDERAAITPGVNKKVLAAAAVGVVVLVAIIVVASGSGDATGAANHDAGVQVVAAVDAGSTAPAVDAGQAAVVVVAAPDAGQAAPVAADAGVVAEAEMKFDADAGSGPAIVDPVVDPVADPTKPRHVDRADPKIDEGIRAVRTAMAKKGLLSGDVPEVEQALVKAHFASLHGNKKDAERDLASARSVVDGQAIDRAFVMSKLTRFNKAYAQSKRPDIADKVEPLARQAATSFSSGQFDQANKTLNRAFALVPKPK